MTETKAIAPSNGNLPANQMTSNWKHDYIDSDDVLIPRLLMMQGLSELVADGKANQGELVKSTSKEVVGGKDKGVEIIPLKVFKTFVISEKVGQKWEYRSQEPVTMQNKDAPLEWNVGAQIFRRDRSLNFYVLFPADIARESEAMRKFHDEGELPDPDDALIPCVLSFRRTSYGAGKELATFFKKAEHFGMSPAVSTFQLSTKLEKNDQGNFWVMTVQKGRKSTQTELDVASKWNQTLSTASVRIDDDADVAPAPTAQYTAPVAQQGGLSAQDIAETF
jgi:hypothetical protein